MTDRPLKLFTGNANRPLAEAIGEHLLLRKLGDADVRRHNDGEVFVEIRENIRNVDVFIVQPLDPADAAFVIEALFLIDAAVGSSAGRVTLVMPYYGYARQDRKDRPRVPIAVRVIADIFQTVGLQRILLVDPHTLQVQALFRHSCKSDTLYARPRLMEELMLMFPDRDRNRRDIVVVAPDVGATKIAQSYANRLGCPMVFFHKQRSEPGRVGSLELVGKVHGRTAIMIDDIVDTAATLVLSAEILHRRGAARILAVAFHPILSGNAPQRIQDSPIEQMIVTDTLAVTVRKQFPKLRVVSIAKLLAQAIQAIHEEKSVSSLID